MKIEVISKKDMRDVIFPEGLLADAIKTHIKKSNFPKKIIIRQLDLLQDKYQENQEQLAKKIIAVKDGNDGVHSDIERLRRKNRELVNELRGKLS